jgi:hypothetical protein
MSERAAYNACSIYWAARRQLGMIASEIGGIAITYCFIEKFSSMGGAVFSVFLMRCADVLVNMRGR